MYSEGGSEENTSVVTGPRLDGHTSQHLALYSEADT